MSGNDDPGDGKDDVLDNLANWSYLTRTYDYDDRLGHPEEQLSPSVGPTMDPTSVAGSVEVDNNSDLLPASLHTPNQIDLPPSLPTPNQMELPPLLQPYYVPVELVVDATNPRAIFLPRQDVSFRPQGCDLPVSIGVGPVLLTSALSASPEQPTVHQLPQGNSSTFGVASHHDTLVNHLLANPPEYNQFRPMQALAGGMSQGMRSSPVVYEQHHADGAVGAQQGIARLNQQTQDSFNFDEAASMSSTAMLMATVATAQTSVGDETKPSGRAKRPLEQPSVRCKPLTPYNYFYRDERDNIIGNLQQQGDPLPPPLSDFSTAKKKQLLHQHWFIDPSKEKRQHRKVHGKIKFPELSKVIAKRWKELSDAGRDFYRQVACDDRNEYDRYLAECKNDGQGSTMKKDRAHSP